MNTLRIVFGIVLLSLATIFVILEWGPYCYNRIFVKNLCPHCGTVLTFDGYHPETEAKGWSCECSTKWEERRDGSLKLR